ncbi:hypothetical protein NPIL_284061 [Nephila pilipes]|uniref:Uncharacterized protein n=1 Tax=Nephila pilipes TaxID=299642 RepID=A0A8X6NES0_NEPPI|nr:hypothetical protein NPIL_284061 [Nephila pilipes]
MLEDKIRTFTMRILSAAKVSISRIKRDDWVSYWKDANIDALIHEHDKLCVVLMANNTDTIRLRFTEICHRVEEKISSCKRKKWAEFCEKLDPRRIS